LVPGVYEETGTFVVRSDADDDWFEVPAEDWLKPKFMGKELKLLADAHVPEAVIQEISGAAISIEAKREAAKGRPDPDVVQLAQKGGRVPLTLGRGFRDDRKHPL